MKKFSALVITDRLRFIGGVETYVEEFATIFKQFGNKVDCLTYFQDFVTKDQSNINMLTYKHGAFNVLGFNVSRFFFFIRKLIKLSKSKKYKYIFLHLYISPFIVFLFNLFPTTKKYLVVHGIRYLEMKSAIIWPIKLNFLNKLKIVLKYGPEIIFYKYIQKYVLRKARRIIVLSSYTKLQIIKYFKVSKEKINIIPGAIDHKIFKAIPLNRKQTLKEKLGFAKTHQLIVLVSRIEPRKNVVAAIQAMSAVVKKFRNTTLLIISPAQDAYNQSYLAECYAKVSENNLGNNVVFITGIDSEATVNYYQIADVALTISNDLETFGYTLIEALACGVPVIGTDVGNIQLILSEIDKRLIAKPSYKDISNKVVNLLELSDKEKNALGEKCSKVIQNKYNYEVFINNYQNLFSNEK